MHLISSNINKPTMIASTFERRKRKFHRSFQVRSSYLTLAVITLLFISYSCLLRTTNSSSSSTTSTTTSGTSQHGFASRAKVCSQDKTWDAYHLPASFQSNMHAHYKEDWEASTYFENLCGGTYLEMGGFDGTKFSNSYAFHKALDWKGVLIEASPTNYALMVKNRPSELATIHAGICAQEQELHFVNKANGGKGAVSGFVEFAAESFKETWWSKEDIQNAEIVRCASLTTVLEEAVGPNFHFDFFSLDVEGAEYDVLMSLNFDLFSFGIIFVEADNHNPAKNDKLRQLLASKGYKFKHHSRNSDWFVNMKFDEIYKQGSK